MSELNGTALWLADFHVMATALLASTLVGTALMKQPARRMAAVKATLAALVALALFCALPGWSVVHLAADPNRRPIEGMLATPTERPVTQLIPHINIDQIPLPEGPREPVRQPRVDESPEPLARRVSWPTSALSIHAMGSLAVAAWLIGGAVIARRIVRRATAAPAEWREALARIVGDQATPELLVSGDVATPVAIGVWRAKVLLPLKDQSASSLPFDQLTSILAHEWAHIQNGDLWTLAASRWLLVLLWPQPLFWWLRRLMRHDQETLADAAAAEAAGRVGYAEQLLAWARGVPGAPGAGTPRLAGAVGLWEGRSQLKRRVAILLNEKFAVMRACSRRWRIACLAATSLAALALSLVTIQPPTRAEETQSVKSDKQASDEGKPTKHRSLALGTFSAVQLDQSEQPVQYKKNGLKLHVVDDAGKPIEGVEALAYRASFKKRTHELAQTARTDEQGAVAFDDLLPADVVAKYQEAAKEGEYPFSLDDSILIGLRKPGLATVLVYQWGAPLAVRGSERTLMMRPAAELRGRVTDPEGRAVAGAMVVAGGFSSIAIEGLNAVTTDADGRYLFKDRVAFNARKAREKQRQTLSFWSPAEELAGKKEAAKPEDPADDLAVSNLMVTHPEFAATPVEGGDVPGVTEVQMQGSATIEGRVVWHDSGKPASGVAVQAAGQLTREGPTEAADVGSTTDFHSAATTTDDQGRYRLTNLPPGSYSVWADPGTQSMNDAEWLSRGHGGLAAKAGESAAAAELVIGPGGVIRGQLADIDTGQPLKLPEGARAQPFMIFEGMRLEPTLIQRVPVTSDGKFEMRTPPGRFRAGVFVHRDQQLNQKSTLYQSDDDIHHSGEVFELEHGETTETKFPVWRVKEIERWREQGQHAYRLQSEGKFAEAVDAFTAMHNKRPDDPYLLLSRGSALRDSGRHKEALADFEKALAGEPDNLSVRLTLVDLLSTAPDAEVRDGARAVRLAEQIVADARKAEPGNNDLRGAAYSRLATAQAEAGDFRKAIEAQEEAVKLAPQERQEETQQRLELYKAGKPFRRESVAALNNRQSQRDSGPRIKLAQQTTLRAGGTATSPSASTAQAGPAVDSHLTRHGFVGRSDAEPNTFKGRTLDEHNEPIAGVEITLYRGPFDLSQPFDVVSRTTTNADGEYRFEDLIDVDQEYPEGDIPTPGSQRDRLFRVVARKAGRISREVGRGQVEVLQQGQASDFIMPPGSWLRGRVTDADGKPVAGARVSKAAAMGSDAWSAMTDANGEYEIDDLAPFGADEERKRQEQQRVDTAAQLAAGADAVLSVSLAPRFEVSHPDYAIAKLPITDIPGRADAALQPAGKIVGRVVDDRGQPVPGALVMALASREQGLPANAGPDEFWNRMLQTSSRTDEEGKFVIGSLFAANFDVWAEAPGLLNRGHGAVAVEFGERTELPNLVLTAGTPITVKVVNAATGKYVDAAGELTAEIALLPAEWINTSRKFPPQSVRLTDDGEAELRALAGKTFVMVRELTRDGRVAWRAAQQGATQIDVRENQPAEVTIEVRPAEAVAEGDQGASREWRAQDNAGELLRLRATSWRLVGVETPALQSAIGAPQTIGSMSPRPTGLLDSMEFNFPSRPVSDLVDPSTAVWDSEPK